MNSDLNEQRKSAEQRVLMAGFGGQGIMLMGQILAAAALKEGKEVSWLPSYGPEMRGGTANCSVILADGEIRSPLIDKDATSAIIMNAPSFDTFEYIVRPGGLLLLNSSLVKRESTRSDVTIVKVPVTDLAIENGNVRAANIIMLGAWLKLTDYVQIETALDVVAETFATKRPRSSSSINRPCRWVREACHQPR